LGIFLPTVNWNGAAVDYVDTSVGLNITNIGTFAGTITVRRTGEIGAETGYDIFAASGDNNGVPMIVNLMGQQLIP